jgi:hypothetical protein
VQRTHGEVVVRGCTWSHRQRRDRRRPPAQRDDVLAEAEVARRDPAAIGGQPRMLRGRVDRLILRRRQRLRRGRLAAVRLGRHLLRLVR